MQALTMRSHLNYFQQSPVRGQLEPTDGTTGDRRFLQCTDVPNELKVLLPARTSVLYGNLLRVERDELRRGEKASWDRIKEIRHLKERMLRKCERLARASAPANPPGQMLALYAPPEFRLREMERWLKYQNQNAGQQPAGYSCCSMCGPLGVPAAPSAPAHRPKQKQVKRSPSVIATRTPILLPGDTLLSRSSSLRSTDSRTTNPPRTTSNRVVPPPSRPAALSKRASSSSVQTLVDPTPEPHYYLAKHGAIQQVSLVKPRSLTGKVSAVPAVIRERERERESSPSPKPIPYRIRDKHASRFEDAPRSAMHSPDPLPIPYRPRAHHEEPNNTAVGHEAARAAAGEAPPPATPPAAPPVVLDAHKVLPEEIPAQPQLQSQSQSQPQATSAGADGKEAAPAPTTGMPLETIHENTGEHEHEDVAARHPLLRRRSSLKKKGSMHSLASQAKSVTWAMDRDWTERTSKFVKATNEADVAAYELDQSRARYHEEIAMMRIACQDAVKAAEKLGLDTHELRHEEAALALQQHKVMAISETIEQREACYRDAVFTVLEETKRIVQLCDKKRETHED